MKFEWEYLLQHNNKSTMRAKVIGGWILRVERFDSNYGQSESMVFIPDPEWNWVITKH